MRIFAIIFTAIISLFLEGCFTGVESTPKITSEHVKKEKIKTTPEQKFMSEIAMQPPADWKEGKRFYVTDSKINLIFTTQDDLSSLVGDYLEFQSIYPVSSLTGETSTEIEFRTPTGKRLSHRVNIPYSEIASRTKLEIPFTIEESIVNEAREKLKGEKYFIATPLWYSQDGAQAVNGLRHVPVEVIDVLPGNDIYPLRILFRMLDDPSVYSLYMTIGNGRTSTRNFYTLFAFDNPRDKYPRITDETWDSIIHSRIKIGMTRDECRLALGSPNTIGQRPTHAGMVEYWSYTDGVYLLFEDGYLSYFRK